MHEHLNTRIHVDQFTCICIHEHIYTWNCHNYMLNTLLFSPINPYFLSVCSAYGYRGAEDSATVKLFPV